MANPSLNCPSAGSACLTSAKPIAATAVLNATGLSDSSLKIGPKTVLISARPFCAKSCKEAVSLL